MATNSASLFFSRRTRPTRGATRGCASGATRTQIAGVERHERVCHMSSSWSRSACSLHLSASPPRSMWLFCSTARLAVGVLFFPQSRSFSSHARGFVASRSRRSASRSLRDGFGRDGDERRGVSVSFALGLRGESLGEGFVDVRVSSQPWDPPPGRGRPAPRTKKPNAVAARFARYGARAPKTKTPRRDRRILLLLLLLRRRRTFCRPRRARARARAPHARARRSRRSRGVARGASRARWRRAPGRQAVGGAAVPERPGRRRPRRRVGRGGAAACSRRAIAACSLIMDWIKLTALSGMTTLGGVKSNTGGGEEEFSKKVLVGVWSRRGKVSGRGRRRRGALGRAEGSGKGREGRGRGALFREDDDRALAVRVRGDVVPPQGVADVSSALVVPGARWKLWLSSLMSRYRASSGFAATFAPSSARRRGSAGRRAPRACAGCARAGPSTTRGRGLGAPPPAEGVGGPTWERSRGVVMGAAEERARGPTRARASRVERARRRRVSSWSAPPFSLLDVRRCPRTAGDTQQLFEVRPGSSDPQPSIRISSGFQNRLFRSKRRPSPAASTPTRARRTPRPRDEGEDVAGAVAREEARAERGL